MSQMPPKVRQELRKVIRTLRDLDPGVNQSWSPRTHAIANELEDFLTGELASQGKANPPSRRRG